MDSDKKAGEESLLLYVCIFPQLLGLVNKNIFLKYSAISIQNFVIAYSKNESNQVLSAKTSEYVILPSEKPSCRHSLQAMESDKEAGEVSKQ